MNVTCPFYPSPVRTCHIPSADPSPSAFSQRLSPSSSMSPSSPPGLQRRTALPTPIFAFYLYPSLPLPSQAIPSMLQHVLSRLQHPSFDRLVVCLSYDHLPACLPLDLQAIPSCQTEYFPAQDYYGSVRSLIWQQITHTAAVGTVVLISESSSHVAGIFQMASFAAWQGVLVHPPGVDCNAASLSLELPTSVCQEGPLRLYERQNSRQLVAVEERRTLPTVTSKIPQIGDDWADEDLSTLIELMQVLEKKSEESRRRDKSKRSRMLVRWRKDTVNRDKMTHCTENGQLCPKWNNKIHTVFDSSCQMWHPHQSCTYYPRCRWHADVCEYAHPFCAPEGEPCHCRPEQRDPQKNHRIV